MNVPRHRLLRAALFGALILPTLAAADGRTVEVRENSDMHSGPGADSFVVGTAESGEKFPLLEARDKWVKVVMKDGVGAWLARDKVEITDVAGEEELATSEDGVDAVVQRARASLYAGPGTQFVVVKKVDRGTRLAVLGRSGDGWIKVRYDGPPVHVRGRDVKIEGSASEVEEIEAQMADPPETFVEAAQRAAGALPIGFVGDAGTGFSQIKHRWTAGRKFSFTEVGFAFNGSVGYWFHRFAGIDVRARYEIAPSSLDVDAEIFSVEEPVAVPLKRDAVKLTMSALSIDAALIARVPVWRVGAYITGRIGWKRYAYDIDPLNASEGDDVTNPAFYPATHSGPFVGAGFRLPMRPWVGLVGTLDVMPVLGVKNKPSIPRPAGVDTASGDVSSDFGFHAAGGLWVTAFESNVDIDIAVMFHWERYVATFVVPDAQKGKIPRTQLPVTGNYETAESAEQSLGGLVMLRAHM